MSPTSYRTAPPRTDIGYYTTKLRVVKSRLGSA